MELRKIKARKIKDRVETGPLQINDDWPGLFVRGDNCLGFAMSLSILKRKIKDGKTISPSDTSILEMLIDLLGSPNVNKCEIKNKKHEQ